MSRMAFLTVLALIGMTAAGGAQARTASVGVDFDADPQAESYGDYLSARFAANRHDLSEAAKFYRASLDIDPKNAELLPFAFFYAACSGDIDGAADLAKRLSADAPDDRAVRLTIAVRDLKHQNYKAARAEIARSAKGPFTAFTVSLIDAWAAAGMGDSAAATADLKSLHKTSGADALAYFDEALLAEYLSQNDVAEANVHLELKSGGLSPRVVEALALPGAQWTDRRCQGAVRPGRLHRHFYPIAAAGLDDCRRQEARSAHQARRRRCGGSLARNCGIAGRRQRPGCFDALLRLTLFWSRISISRLLLADRLEALEKYDDAVPPCKRWTKTLRLTALRRWRLPSTKRGWSRPIRQLQTWQRFQAVYPSDVILGPRSATPIARQRNSPRPPKLTIGDSSLWNTRRRRLGHSVTHAPLPSSNPTIGRPPKPTFSRR